MSYLIKAIKKLKPSSEFSLNNDDYSTIKWDILEGNAPTKKEINKELFTNITKDLPISNDLQVDTKPKRGRPKGSKTNYDTLEFNREAKTLDISQDTPIITKKKKGGRPKKSKK